MQSNNSLSYATQQLIANGAKYPRTICVSNGSLACISLASQYAARSGKKTLIVDLDASERETTLHLTPKPNDVVLESQVLNQSDLVTAIDADMNQYVADASHYVITSDTAVPLTMAANAVANCTFNQVVTILNSPIACELVTTCNTGDNLYLMRCDQGFSVFNELFAASIYDNFIKANSMRLPQLCDVVWFIDALLLSIRVPATGDRSSTREQFDRVYFSVGMLNNSMDYVAKLAAIRSEFLAIIAYATSKPAINVHMGLQSIDNFYRKVCTWPDVLPLINRPVLLPVLLCNFMVVCDNECDSVSVRMLMEINKAVNLFGASGPVGIAIRPPDACLNAQLFIPLMPTFANAAFESACALTDLDNEKIQFYVHGRNDQHMAVFTCIDIGTLLPIAQKQITVVSDLYNQRILAYSLR